jgi:hypothetical protein
LISSKATVRERQVLITAIEKSVEQWRSTPKRRMNVIGLTTNHLGTRRSFDDDKEKKVTSLKIEEKGQSESFSF